jgi:hypothetical protein
MKKPKEEKEKKFKLTSKISSKGILKPNKMTVTINERQPAEYTPIYFKNEVEQAKKSMFFD